MDFKKQKSEGGLQSSMDPSATLKAAAPFLAEKIEHLAVSLLKPYSRELRKHSDYQVDKLCAAINRAGFLVPIIVDRDNIIVAGHGRWKAACKLGLKVVPVIRADHLTLNEIKAFRIAENRIGELSAWSDNALAIELKELLAIEVDPGLVEILGFETGELGSGLIGQSQKITAAAMQIAEKKVCAHRS